MSSNGQDMWGSGPTTPQGGGSTSRGSSYSSSSAPWLWLFIGAALTVVVFVISLFLKPEGIGPNLTYWFISMAAYLVPFVLFITSELKARSSSVYYRTSASSVKMARAIYLVFGLLMSSFFVYAVADEISRILNSVN